MRRSLLLLFGRVSYSLARTPRREQNPEVNAVDDLVAVEVSRAPIAHAPIDEEESKIASIDRFILIEDPNPGPPAFQISLPHVRTAGLI